MLLSQKKSASLILAALSVPTLSQAAITITADYTYDSGSWFTTERKNVIELVLDMFESSINDSFSSVNFSDGSTWKWTFNNPSSGASVDIVDPTVSANNFVVYLGAQDLGGSTLGQGGNIGYTGSFTQNAIDALDARNSTSNYDPIGGVISFNSSMTWFATTDPYSSEAISGFDLYSVFAHEMLHVLGIGIANAWDDQVSSLEFLGAESTALYGGNVPLHDDPESSGPAAHWDSGISALAWNGTAYVSQSPLMAPSIATDTRKFITDLDWAGLEDIGYSVTPVPEPKFFASAFALIALVFTGMRKRRR